MEAVSILTTAVPIVEDGVMEKRMDTVSVLVPKGKVNTRVHGNMVMNFPASTYG
jgi:hypothetical protein